MNRYKVLPLPFYFESTMKKKLVEQIVEKYTAIKPIFNRYGMYYDRQTKKEWIETVFGCWQLPSGEFNCHFDSVYNDYYILHPDVVKAIKTLKSHNLLTKNLNMKYLKHRDAVDIRNVGRNTRKFYISNKNKKRK